MLSASVHVTPLVGLDCTAEATAGDAKGSHADGANADARFNAPAGLVTVGMSVVIVDTENHCVRSFDRSSGSVVTIAGEPGQKGGRDGCGKSAQFNEPCRAAALSETVVVITDFGNHCVRLLDIASGDVTTLAGKQGSSGHADGCGSAARFNGPYGVAVLHDGRVAISEIYNHCVRLLDLKTQTVTTVAGYPGKQGSVDGVRTNARFCNPMQLCQLRDGRLVVADSGNDCLRSVDIATGMASTLKLTGSQLNKPQSVNELRRDGVVVTDACGAHLFDPTTCSLVTLATTVQVGPLGKERQATLDKLRDTAVMPDGGLAVTDGGNHGIWMMTLPVLQDQFVAALIAHDGPLALRLLDAGAHVDALVCSRLLSKTGLWDKTLCETLAIQDSCSGLVERIAATSGNSEIVSLSHSIELLRIAVKRRRLKVASRIISHGVAMDDAANADVASLLSERNTWRAAVLDESCVALVDIVAKLEPTASASFFCDSDVLIAALTMGARSAWVVTRLLDRGATLGDRVEHLLLADDSRLLREFMLSQTCVTLMDRIEAALPRLAPHALLIALESFAPQIASRFLKSARLDESKLLKTTDGSTATLLRQLFLDDACFPLAVQLTQRSPALKKHAYSSSTLHMAIRGRKYSTVTHLLDERVAFDESEFSAQFWAELANESQSADLVARLVSCGKAKPLSKIASSPQLLKDALTSCNPLLAQRLIDQGVPLDQAWCAHWITTDEENFTRLVLHSSREAAQLVGGIVTLSKIQHLHNVWVRCLVAALQSQNSVAALRLVNEQNISLDEKRVTAALKKDYTWHDLVVLERCAPIVDRILDARPELVVDAIVAACTVQNSSLGTRLLSRGRTSSEQILKALIAGPPDKSKWCKLLLQRSCHSFAQKLVEEIPALKERTFTSDVLVSAISSNQASLAQWLMENDVKLRSENTSVLLSESHGSAWQTLLLCPSDESIALADRLMESYQALKDAAVSSEMLLVALDARDTVVANRLMELGACLDDRTRSKFVGSGGDSAWRTLLFDTHDSCIALADRLMESSAQLKEAALSPPMLLAALDARSTRAANRLMDLGAAIDAAAALHLRNTLEPKAPLAFEEVLKLPGAIVRESAHPYPDSADTFEQIRCLAVSVVS
jgi:hypothetical protein